MKAIDVEGSFRAKVLEWGVGSGKEGGQAVRVAMKGQVVAAWNFVEKRWDDWTGFEPRACYADAYIVGNDGGLNVTGIDQLVASIGYDGDLTIFEQPPPDGLHVIVDVRADSYNGKVTHKVRWISPDGHEPGTGGGIARRMDKSSVQELNARLGDQLRAAAAAAKAKHASGVPF